MTENVFFQAENQSAKHDKCVVFGVDEKYLPFALFTAQQIHDRNPNRDFDICIASEGEVLAHPLIEELDLRAVALNFGPISDLVDVGKRLSVATYLRLAFVFASQNDYRRALYLDSDIFYEKGDISRLLDIDLKGAAVGAVQDNCQLRTSDHQIPEFAVAGLPSAKYFNAGVLLFDFAELDKIDLLAEVISMFEKHGAGLSQLDQSVLNLVMYNKWAELSLVWNAQYDFRNLFPLALSDPHFIHFFGPAKPWNRKPFAFIPKKYTRAYALFLAQHFPELAAGVPDGLEFSVNRKDFRFAAIVNVFNALRMLPRIERDFDPWLVRGPVD